MLTLALILALQQVPSPEPVTPSPTRETVKRGGTRAGRIGAMTGVWFGAVFTTAAVGVIPGALLGAAGGGSFSALAGGLIGGIIGAGVGALVSPLLVWGIGRALDGKGSLAATFIGSLVGLALCAGATLASVYSYGDRTAATVFGVMAAVTGPLVIAAGPWAYEISHSINSGTEVSVLPTVTPLKDGAIAGLAMTF